MIVTMVVRMIACPPLKILMTGTVLALDMSVHDHAYKDDFEDKNEADAEDEDQILPPPLQAQAHIFHCRLP